MRQLRGVRFEWRQDDFPEKKFESGAQIGLIAQEVENVLPEVVSTDEDGFKSVAYQNITAVLIEALKEQQAQIEALRTEVES